MEMKEEEKRNLGNADEDDRTFGFIFLVLVG
jgi:hypothetical protein